MQSFYPSERSLERRPAIASRCAQFAKRDTITGSANVLRDTPVSISQQSMDGHCKHAGVDREIPGDSLALRLSASIVSRILNRSLGGGKKTTVFKGSRQIASPPGARWSPRPALSNR